MTDFSVRITLYYTLCVVFFKRFHFKIHIVSICLPLDMTMLCVASLKVGSPIAYHTTHNHHQISNSKTQGNG